MSKAFAVKVVVSDQVTMRTTDGTSSVVVDQVAGATMTASGAGKIATVIGDDDATVLVTSDGNDVSITIPSIPMGIALDPTLTLMALTNPGGRITTTSGDFVATATNDVNLIADANVLQTLLEVRNNATLDPADAVYLELNNTDVPDLINSSRLNIVPDAAGTVIHSIFTNAAVPNVPHKVLLIMNTGTDPAQTRATT
jgi:hypothetical protein